MSERPETANPRPPHARLWVAIMAVTVAALVVLIVVCGQWWPSGTDWYLPAGAAAAILVATGAAWGIDSIYVLWKRRRWAWWMPAWPVVTALAVALVFVVQPEFHDVRPDFEAVAHQLLAGAEPTSLHDDFDIGRFEVDTVYSTPRGDVFFSDNRRSMFNTESGWVYSPDGAPASPTRDGEFSAEHHEGPWYRYSRVIDF